MNLSTETQELLDSPVDLNDAGHEYADGHEDVLYTSRAHATVRDTPFMERSDAEERVSDMSEGFVGYDDLATRIAYWIVRNRFEARILAELEDYRKNYDLPEDHADAIRKILGR
jgi:hypothetical protein